MEQIKQYLVSVLASAILCSIIIRIVDKQNVTVVIVKMSASVLLTVTLFAPLLKLQFNELSTWIDAYKAEANLLVSDGMLAATKEKSSIIKERVETYILDKATSYGIEIRVNIEFSDSNALLPDQVVIEGAASPYAKQRLQKTIADDLGIPLEKQIWM